MSVAVVGALMLPRAAMADDDSPVAKGATLFANNCARCHGPDGAGGRKFSSGAVSADLRAPGLEQTYHGDDRLILRAILEAKDEDGKRLDHPMPAWRDKLSERQAKEILAYLHTLRS